MEPVGYLSDADTRKLWDKRAKIAAKDSALTDDERKDLGVINARLAFDTMFSVSDDSAPADGDVLLSSRPMVEAMKLVINLHLKTYHDNKGVDQYKAEDALVALHYAAYTFCVDVATSLGKGFERFHNFSSNVNLEVNRFIMSELDVDTLDDDPRFILGRIQ